MKRLYVLFVLIVVACSPAKNESDAVDSTQISADTATITLTSDAQNTPSEAALSEPSTIFPELLDTPFTDDVRETTVVGPLFALPKQYESDKIQSFQPVIRLVTTKKWGLMKQKT